MSVSRVFAAVSASRVGDEVADARVEARQIADRPEADAFSCSLATSCSSARRKSSMRNETSSAGPPPVLAAEREQRQEFDAVVEARAHRGAHRFHTLAMAGNARQQPLLRPAPVAVHDDGDVARHGAGWRNFEGGALEQERPERARRGQTAIRSASFALQRCLSISAMWRSVSFCTSSCARRSSSSETFFSLSRFFR